jgi:hypothetical protein
MNTPHFKVKNFHIINGTTNLNHEVPDNIKSDICGELHPLEDNTKQHYNPRLFFDYLMMISQLNPDTTYYAYYKYEYFNHDHINEYQNALQIKNSVIIDDLASKVTFQEYMTLGSRKEENKINIVI